MDVSENAGSLEDLFTETRGLEVSDPSAMDTVLIYLEQLNDETECFMKDLVQKLEYASITWEQPWYQQSTCLTRPLKENVDNHDSSYQTGTITKDEIDKIEKNWRKFKKRYHVPDKLICLARWRNREKNSSLPEEKARIFTVAFLARGLERTMFQVYRHIVSYYGTPKRGHYTKDEETVMQICFHHCPRKAVPLLSTVLARDPRGIYKKLHYTVNGKPPKHRLKWDLELASKFVKLLMEYTGEPLEKLKYKKIDLDVWMKLEKDFDKQYEYLQHFWNTTLHCQLFVKCKVTLRKLRRSVFKVLRSSSYKVWHDIRWKEVQNKFPDGFTWKILYWITARIFYKYNQYSKAPLQDLVDYGLEMIRSSNNPRSNKKLKTLQINSDGNLEVTYYDTKLRVSYF